MTQNSNKEPNYGNRPTKDEGFWARAVRRLAKARPQDSAAAETENKQEAAEEGGGARLRAIALAAAFLLIFIVAPVFRGHHTVSVALVSLAAGLVSGVRLGGGHVFRSLVWGLVGGGLVAALLSFVVLSSAVKLGGILPVLLPTLAVGLIAGLCLGGGRALRSLKWGLLGLFAAMSFLSLFALSPLITWHVVFLTLLVSLSAGLTSGLCFGGRRVLRSILWGLLGLFAAASFLWGGNRLLDDGTHKELLTMPITGKYISHRQRPHLTRSPAYYVEYVLKTSPDSKIRFSEEADGKEGRVYVRKDVYDLMSPGKSQASVVLRQGYFSMPWIDDPQPIP